MAITQAGNQEVALLQQICLTAGVPADQLADSEVPLLTQWLNAILVTLP